jgi:hypothetical protein
VATVGYKRRDESGKSWLRRGRFHAKEHTLATVGYKRRDESGKSSWLRRGHFHAKEHTSNRGFQEA